MAGLSMGGMVAVAWARWHSEECLGAVLINTSLRPHGRFHERLRPGAMTALLRMSATRGVERERAIAEREQAMVMRHTGVPNELRKKYRKIMDDADMG